MNLSSIAKKNCYYSLNCVGLATVDAFKIEFKSYYTSPDPFGMMSVEEVDLPPLDGNTAQTDISSEYSQKFQHVDAEYLGYDAFGSGFTYEAQTLDKKSSSYWKFYEYNQTTTVFPDVDAYILQGQLLNELIKGTINTSLETFVIALKSDWLSFEVDDDNKVSVTSQAEKLDIYSLPFSLASPTGYNMDIGGPEGAAGDQADIDLETIVAAATAGTTEGNAYTFKAVGKDETNYIEDFSFEYDTPYTKDGITASGVEAKALDADVKFRYHYYLKDYEDAVNNLSDASTSIAEVAGLGLALKISGDRVEYLLPSPYEYEYANFVLDNPYYANISSGNGNEQVSPLVDTTKNVLNSIAVFNELYGTDYVDYTSLGGKISFALIKDGAVIDYLREWSKIAKWYQGKAEEFESKQVEYVGEGENTEALVYEHLSEVAKNRNRFLAESTKIDAEDPAGIKVPGLQANVPSAPDTLNSLLNNATFDYFNFNHPDIEKYFGDLDFTLRNSLNIGQKNSKVITTAAAFPMSVEIKFKYPILTLFHPLAQRTKEWLPNKVNSNLGFDPPGGSMTLEKHGGLMQKIMAMNLADPFMRYVVSGIDLPSGGPTPINEKMDDPTIFSATNKTPNFAKQTKILQKEQYGYRTNSIKLHSRDLYEIIDEMVGASLSPVNEENPMSGLNAKRRTSKTFFSDRAEDFFLPMDDEKVLELLPTVREHMKVYEDINGDKGTRRDFKDILEGKKCFVETLFFGIEKYEVTRDDRGRHVPINRSNSVQRFFVTPPPLAGNGNTDEYVRYVDTQVKYGKKYVYQTFAYVLVYGTKYRCSDITETSKNSELAVATSGEEVSAPIPAFEVTYQTSPAYKIFKVPYHGIDFEDKGGVFFPTTIKSNPPTAPYMSVVGYRDVNDKILINMQPSSGDVLQFPIPIKEDEKFSYEIDPADIYYNNSPSGMIRFTADDRIGGYRIYRLDTPPSSYEDFKNATIFEIDTNQGSSLKDTIRPNVRYYYTAKSIDIHGMYSNPCPVMSVEIVDEKGLIYSVVEEYQMNMSSKKTRTKAGRKAVYISPEADQIKIAANGNPENPTLGIKNKSIFGKRFKVRLTSKKTNKMVDFNVRFDQVDENKKTLEKTSFTTKEFLPKHTSYSIYGDLLTPDFDLALAIALGAEYEDKVAESETKSDLYKETSKTEEDTKKKPTYSDSEKSENEKANNTYKSGRG